MSDVTRLPPFEKTIHVEAEIPISRRDDFERAIVDIIAGERPRMDALEGRLRMLVIDGREISWEQFGGMVMGFEGWQLGLRSGIEAKSNSL